MASTEIKPKDIDLTYAQITVNAHEYHGTLIAHANCTQTLLGIVCSRCQCFSVFLCIFAVSVPPLEKLLMEINPQMLRSALLF